MPSSTTVTTVACSSVVTAVSAALAGYYYYTLRQERLNVEREIASWQQKRQEERTGRIRAEVKLRQALAKLSNTPSATTVTINNANGKVTNSGHSLDEALIVDDHALLLSTLGTVQSPFPKRMGTPRQGSLVPAARGCIQFSDRLDPTSLDGIQNYSHLWVVFGFHQNTNLADSRKTKIRPPRAPRKVGQLATRSPHRPNPVGLSLVKFERWKPSKRQLHISALDLVSGTPVYDVKPFVPWDLPLDMMTTYDLKDDDEAFTVPSWVNNTEDALTSVIWEPKAQEALESLGRTNQLHPLLYPSKDPTSVDAARRAIEQILAQDPRSSHRGLAKNQRGTVSSASTTVTTTKKNNRSNGNSTDTDVYRLIFGGAVVEFVVEASGAIVKHILEAPVEIEVDNGAEDI